MKVLRSAITHAVRKAILVYEPETADTNRAKMTNNQIESEREALRDERRQALEQLEDWLERPLPVLCFAWLALLIVELAWGLSPLLETVGIVIWIIFILDFGLKFFLAPDKSDYLKGNWLTVVALVVPALRIFRVGAAAARGARAKAVARRHFA